MIRDNDMAGIPARQIGENSGRIREMKVHDIRIRPPKLPDHTRTDRRGSGGKPGCNPRDRNSLNCFAEVVPAVASDDYMQVDFLTQLTREYFQMSLDTAHVRGIKLSYMKNLKRTGVTGS
jgi:hypothetical protein